MKTLYLFDFDGTLTTKDTMFDFLKHSFPERYKLVFLFYIPFFVLVKMNILSASFIKRNFINSFLKGKSLDQIQQISSNYFFKRKDALLKTTALDYLQNIHSVEDKYIVSSSLNLWLKPFAEFLNLRLICTEAKFVDGKYTGKFSTKNCNYSEKLNRVKAAIDIDSFDRIFVFGDSSGDQQLLSIATDPYLNYFRK